MRPCSAALKAFLEAEGPINRACVQMDLYTFALVTGEVFRWSGGNAALTVPAAGFPTGSINAGADRTFTLAPRFGRSMMKTKIGVEPTGLDIEVMAGAGDLVGTMKFAEAARLGLFDGAAVELDRFFAPPQASGSGALDTSLGCLLWFYGRVAECEIGRSMVRIRVNNLLDLLAIHQFPRRLYHSSCGHVFGGAMCGYGRVLGENALGAATGVGQVVVTASAGSTQGFLYTGGVPLPAAYAEGTLIGATGANTGYSRTIANLGDGSGQVGMFQAFFFPVAEGDTFNALPGCNHTADACENTFDNLARYPGFNHIPPPENAILWLLSFFSSLGALIA